MTKAIYSMKMEIVFDGNEDVLKLFARELLFNRFTLKMYMYIQA